eukprot:scaffold321227_cov32-Tisochrysis_lutea.AAC.1
MSVSASLASRASLLSAALGLGLGVGLSYLYARLKKSKKSRFSNPNWGLIRVRGIELAKQESEEAAKQAAQAAAQAAAARAAAKAAGESTPSNSIPISELPDSIMKKHPKGCGMDLVKIDAPVSNRHC